MLFVCRIVIENLNKSYHRTDLETVFGQFGVISTLNFRVGSHALLKYSVPDAAQLAIQRMNCVQLGGYCLCVSISSS